MFPTSGLTEIIYIIPQLWLKRSALCYLRLPQAPSWVLDLRGLRQHSPPHLSDRCLPPKQWIIVVLHLSGGTHLVWSAAFFLLFLVTAWHPQPAYPAPFFFFFFSRAWHADALSLSDSICLCLSLSFSSPSGFFFLRHLFPALFFVSDQVAQIKGTSRLCVRKKEEYKSKRICCYQGNKGGSNLSSSCLVSDWVFTLLVVWYFSPSSFSILQWLYSSVSQLLFLVGLGAERLMFQNARS